MAYFLHEHKNPHGDHFYAKSKAKKVGVVVHITAGLQGSPDGHDSSAEKTARYAATTDRAVSWHSGSDCDSVVYLLPWESVAFHVRGYNSSTVGHEISKRDVKWSDEDPEWVEKTLRHAAVAVAKACSDLSIPVRKVSKSQLDAAIKAGDPSKGGLIGHASLDPSRRSDPGNDFPWDRFLGYVKEAQGGKAAPAPSKPAPAKPAGDTTKTRALQAAVNVKIDGAWGPNTDRALALVRNAANGRLRNYRATQAAVGTKADGLWGPKSRAALIATVKEVQKALGVKADGDWGPKTEAAFAAARQASYKG